MRSILHLLLAMMILPGAYSAAARQQGEAAKAPPRQTNDYFPEKWKEFASREGKFKILFPGTPVEWARKEGSAYTVSYKSFISYSASVMDVPDAMATGDAKSVLDKARESVLAISVAAKETPRIAKEVEETFQGHPGRILQVDLGNNRVASYKFILVKNRLFVAEVITPKGSADPASAENEYEKIAAAFLDSFKLIE